MQGLSFLPSYADFLYSADVEHIKPFAASMNRNQYRSKRWLFQELQSRKITAQSAMIIGGWYGTYTIPMLVHTINPKKIFFIEKDLKCIEAVKILHQEIYKQGVLQCLNWDAIEQAKEIGEIEVDLIINTACEHMADMACIRSKNNRCVYAFQSTDSRDDGHINICENVDQLYAQSGIIQWLYKDSIQINNKNRHMIIGTKTLF